MAHDDVSADPPASDGSAERLQVLLSRAAEDQLSEQRRVSAVLADLRSLMAGLDAQLGAAASADRLDQLATDVHALADELRADVAGLRTDVRDELAPRVADLVLERAGPVLVQQIAEQVTERVLEEVRSASELTERRLGARVDEAVLALAEVLLRRRRGSRGHGAVRTPGAVEPEPEEVGLEDVEPVAVEPEAVAVEPVAVEPVAVEPEPGAGQAEAPVAAGPVAAPAVDGAAGSELVAPAGVAEPGVAGTGVVEVPDDIDHLGLVAAFDPPEGLDPDEALDRALDLELTPALVDAPVVGAPGAASDHAVTGTGAAATPADAASVSAPPGGAEHAGGDREPPPALGAPLPEAPSDGPERVDPARPADSSDKPGGLVVPSPSAARPEPSEDSPVTQPEAADTSPSGAPAARVPVTTPDEQPPAVGGARRRPWWRPSA